MLSKPLVAGAFVLGGLTQSGSAVKLNAESEWGLHMMPLNGLGSHEFFFFAFLRPVLFFVEGTPLPEAKMTFVILLWLTVTFCIFVYVGTSCPRQESVGLEGAGGPVGFEPVAGERDVILTSCSSASGLVTAVDNTMLVSSSRRPAPVNRLSLPWAPCLPTKKEEEREEKRSEVTWLQDDQRLQTTGASCSIDYKQCCQEVTSTKPNWFHRWVCHCSGRPACDFRLRLPDHLRVVPPVSFGRRFSRGLEQYSSSFLVDPSISRAPQFCHGILSPIIFPHQATFGDLASGCPI